MEKLAGSEELAVRMGREASKVRERFSLQSVVKEWLDLLNEI